MDATACRAVATGADHSGAGASHQDAACGRQGAAGNSGRAAADIPGRAAAVVSLDALVARAADAGRRSLRAWCPLRDALDIDAVRQVPTGGPFAAAPLDAVVAAQPRAAAVPQADVVAAAVLSVAPAQAPRREVGYLAAQIGRKLAQVSAQAVPLRERVLRPTPQLLARAVPRPALVAAVRPTAPVLRRAVAVARSQRSRALALSRRQAATAAQALRACALRQVLVRPPLTTGRQASARRPPVARVQTLQEQAAPRAQELSRS
jgi:hypothetical protein